MLAMALCLGGCVNQMTGDVMSAYSVDHLIPHILEKGDTGMACETGVSMGGFLASFGRVTDEPHRAAIPTMLTAAVCAQEMAFSADLASRRAIKRGDAAEAVDARIVEKRYNVQAARRFKDAYERTVAQYGEPGGKCPELETRYDEMAWMLGMVSALQALQHDMASENAVGIPLDVPAKAGRGAMCLNNERWWGVPQAIRALVWTVLPGEAPEGADPWQELDAAAALGMKSGVRLPQAIQAQAAAGAGKDDVLRSVITAHGESIRTVPSASKWATVDRIATEQILYLSDRFWTEAEGHRTPFGQLGTFPGAADAGDDDDDDLLDGLDESTPAPTPAPPGAAADQPRADQES